MSTTLVDDTARYAADVIRTLWPGDGTARRMIALPAATTPRMLVPARPARVGAAAVQGLTSTRSLGGRVRRAVVAAAIRSGAGPLLTRRAGLTVRGVGIEEHLSGVLGVPVQAGVLVGAPRANRKPVLVLLRPDGRPVGYAKIGMSPLTAALVEAEAAALHRLGQVGLASVVTPELLHRGTWQTAEVSIQTALSISRATQASFEATIPALQELSAIGSGPAPLAACPAWAAAQDRLATAGDERAVALSGRAEQLATAAGHLEVPVGAWHGDWTPWNLARRGQALLAWDWERFATGIPAGWDALHWTVQQAAGPRGQSLAAATRHMLGRAAELLAPFGVARPAATAVACAYLVEIGSRYVHDGAYGLAGATERWLLPALDAGIARLRSSM